MEQVVELTDLDEMQAALSVAYGKMRIHGGDGRSWMRLRSRRFGPVRFDVIDSSIGFEATSGPQSAYIFGYLDGGRARYRTSGDYQNVLPGHLLLTGQPEFPYSVVAEDPKATLVVVDRAVVDRFAGGVRFTSCTAVSARAAAAWRSTCVHLRDEVLPAFEDEPLVVENATRLLIATTLATFPNVSLVDYGPGQARPHALKRAIAYIESEAEKDITAADIARAARVSLRAIQLAFRRHLDTTPTAYVRRVRLAQAHLDLQRRQGTVTEIAARWGYARPSVFAAHYRSAYGVSPSQTLRSG
ncbi:helix-turn-helix transcriptional regulator [Lentzea sp. NPDC042327]|uniref:helix-turn-helix transcriptional regulator n=1 Tax=Lentzea sp. NPDC042327 TaxID=3154801 RepID=UPI0033C4A482